jgi:hypothetical protein
MEIGYGLFIQCDGYVFGCFSVTCAMYHDPAFCIRPYCACNDLTFISKDQSQRVLFDGSLYYGRLSCIYPGYS